MAWFYEIRDSNKVVAETGKGFASHNAAMTAGRKKARELKASGSLPGGEVVTVGTRQDFECRLGNWSGASAPLEWFHPLSGREILWRAF